MQEKNTFFHASKASKVMHACGHDGHTTMLLGAARYLAETRNFAGTVHLIFQPAEEGRGGAEAMIADGLFVITSERDSIRKKPEVGLGVVGT